MKLNIGDTVTLKSGGPIMTVDVVNENSLLCKWFAGSPPELKQGAFNEESLKQATPRD